MNEKQQKRYYEIANAYVSDPRYIAAKAAYEAADREDASVWLDEMNHLIRSSHRNAEQYRIG